jgi:hypothetical protein
MYEIDRFDTQLDTVARFCEHGIKHLSPINDCGPDGQLSDSSFPKRNLHYLVI